MNKFFLFSSGASILHNTCSGKTVWISTFFGYEKRCLFRLRNLVTSTLCCKSIFSTIPGYHWSYITIIHSPIAQYIFHISNI